MVGSSLAESCTLRKALVPFGDQEPLSLSSASSYRPVALLNTMGKALKSMVAHRISYMTEIYQLLLKTLLRDQKIVFTEQTIYTLLKQIYEA